jgi:hypothetical protein
MNLRISKYLRPSVRTLALAGMLGCSFYPANANIVLGTAQSFAVLGASTVTNTGTSVITGSIGVSPGSALVGFPPGTMTGGTFHVGDAVAAQAQADALIAYNQIASLAMTQDLTDQDLGGLILTPGVYFFSSSAQLTGMLTLDGQNLENPLFAFQIGSTLTTASASSFNLINGADSCDVFFQVGTSATLGTGTAFVGTIIAAASDVLTTDVTLDGRVIALNGAVTLDSNVITIPDCLPGSMSPVPEFAATGWAGAGLLLLVGARRIRSRRTQPAI